MHGDRLLKVLEALSVPPRARARMEKALEPHRRDRTCRPGFSDGVRSQFSREESESEGESERGGAGQGQAEANPRAKVTIVFRGTEELGASSGINPGQSS